MLHRSLLTAALLAGTVAARGQLGFCLGGRTPDNKCKTTEDYKADFEAIKANSAATMIRTYSTGGECQTAKAILPAAKDAGMKVLLGMWPAKGGEPWEDEKAGLLAANIDQYGDAVYGVVVGSEGIYRKEYTTAQLLSWIEEMQQAYPDKLIGTADTWSGWSGGSMDPIISSGIKLILANSFPYWQYQDIKNATKTYFDTMSQALGHVQKLTKGGEGIHFINGETGWPSDGGSNADAAIAGTANLQTYWDETICGGLTWDIDVVVFEAFDEPYKAPTKGDNGVWADEAHWGTFDAGRKPKIDMKCAR